MGRSALRLLGPAIAAALLVAGPADAAVVSVNSSDDPASPSQLYTLELTAAAGETNAIAITAAAASGDTVTYTVRDTSTAPTAGAGCAAEVPGEVRCTMPRSRASEGCNHATCTIAGASVQLALGLDDGDDSVDLSALPAGDGGSGSFSTLVDAGSGADTIVGSPAPDRIDPGPGADSVSAGAGGADYVSARSGGPDGADNLDLGAGDQDTVSYDKATDAVTISIDGVADDGAPGEGDNVSGAEHVVGGSGDDTIMGPDVLEPYLDGGLGSDRIVGGSGADLILGGPFGAPDGDDVIDGGAGNDRVEAADGDDTIDGGPGNDVLNGNTGSDTARGGGGPDRISGGGGPDRIAGDGGADVLFGGGGADLLTALGGGPDRLACGGGRDRATFDRQDTARSCER